ncbi:DUF4291 family protein [Candidatus Bipolaricaulota bacterium]|nr:DUF4291 family protein [Candidatus Bipolaricaulota bacterium]
MSASKCTGYSTRARCWRQLGLRKHILASYAREWTVQIEDVSGFLRDQHRHVLDRVDDPKRWYENMVMPRETVYPVHDPSVAARIGVEPRESCDGP